MNSVKSTEFSFTIIPSCADSKLGTNKSLVESASHKVECPRSMFYGECLNVRGLYLEFKSLDLILEYLDLLLLAAVFKIPCSLLINHQVTR